ncbi:hypothetical protein E1180_21830 [Roseibium denhamense]|uniref:Uncharacterized protein n=1 Tax=Roseibium denhamense TaxID=76305 RepID=A0ABY1NRU8_9HYPH|nr:hypothetical protein [Roseibium denhamense]MTI08145.1 hypothetical protein [Roseibium denhamense]SMP16700.1 hypothetical protein SAMN06265374_1741 [Roseibium denhamense]
MGIFWLWALVCLGITLVVWFPLIAFVHRKLLGQIFVVLLGLTALGATVGVLGGLSREGAVGEITAAVLGLLGGVVVWIFATDLHKKADSDSQPHSGALVSVCVFAFSLSLFLSYIQASQRRADPERFLFWRAQCVEMFSDQDKLTDPLTFTVMSDSFGKICANIFKYETGKMVKGEPETRP